MTSDEQLSAFIKALAEVQKQNDLILMDMIKTYCKNYINPDK